MPKKPINYSNTIIYKLCCKDPTVTDVYVGHTTDFTCRKNHHKTRCNNPSDAQYHYKVYQFIRNHGGWENWSMVEIERLECIDKNDAEKNERKHFELLCATLNTYVPGRSQKEHYRDHAEELKEYQRQYRLEHSEEINEQQRHAYQEHKVEINERNRQYWHTHKDELNERKRQYRLEHKDKINEKQRQSRLKKKETTLALLR